MNYQEMRRARKEQKITQEKLAQILNVNRATISKYETGIIEPSISQLQTISSCLGVSFSKLAGSKVSTAYDEGFKDGSEAEEWQNHVIDELRKQEGYTGSEIEGQLIAAFSHLNPSGQQEAVKRVEELTEVPRYQKEKTPADGD